MSIKETPRARSANQLPAQNAGVPTETATFAARMVAVLRIGMGLIFFWAFLDKLFGFGYATSSANAWINGGSPTKGFLGGLNHGPFRSMFNSWAGDTWADWLFMLGLAGIGLALLLGIGMRIAAVSGTLMLLLMWTAAWPLDQHTATGQLTRSTNPIIDDHLIYTIVLITLAALGAGTVWGLGKYWANLDFVKKNRWLI